MNLRKYIRKVISESLEEDITPVDDAVSFDYNAKEKAKNINTSLGKSSANIKFSPRISTLKNSRVKVVSAYSKNTGGEVTDILKSIKKTKDSKYSLEQKDYDHFLNRTAIFFVRYLKDKNIDSIFVMESSSPLAGDIALKIKNMLPNTSIKFLGNSIIKNIENLTIEKSEDDKISDSEMEGLEKLYNKAKETGEFSIKKIHPRHRKFFTNWIQVNKEAINSITNKNIILFDDYITSGATLDEACKELLKLSPESINVITLIK
jgi:phosphoribosylpyrophosphate synthetase